MISAGFLQHPFIDPVLVKIYGPFAVRWYGLMYLLGFILAYLIIRSELKRRKGPIPYESAEDLLFQIILGLLVGARIGYAVIYNPAEYFPYIWKLLYFWDGGMSFHGGLIGIVVFGFLFTRRRKAPFWELADIVALSAPLGLMFGRIGNFINGELVGRVTDLPWGIVFTLKDEDFARHPSQLYEAFFEGLVLFLILWKLRLKTKVHGELVAAFLMGYGLFRFLVEFFRQPDIQMGFYFRYFTMGQILCTLMVIGGFGLLVFLRRQGVREVDSKAGPG